MSYRDDHDAALARVDALEHELASVRDRDRDIPATLQPKPRKPWLLLGACIAALTMGIVGGVAVGASGGDTRAVEKPAPGVSTVEPRLLEGCMPASCREAVHGLLEGAAIRADERAVLVEWATAEDELAGAATRRDVYYANDPFALDGYSTARQVEIEYERALAMRERAVARWRVRFGEH
jgi:hypothetical protein